MKRQLLDAKREGGFINNEVDSLPPNYLPVLGYPHAAQPRQNEESLPVPLPMFKRLRITSGVACSPHDCTSITIDKVPNITEIGQGPQSLLYSQQQQHYRFQKYPQYYSDGCPETGLIGTTRPALVAGGIHTPSPYSNINQLLGNLHRERKNRSHMYTSTACEGYEGGRSTADYLDCLLYTNHNQEHSDANSTSSLSSCTTPQQAAAASTYHHALVVEKTPRSYRTKLYTDSRLF
jgi:hypothetical protein